MTDLPRGPLGILDTFGTVASLLCAVHCAVTPMAMALLPLVGLEFLGAEATEYTLVGLSSVVGSVSLVPKQAYARLAFSHDNNKK
jgi:hypothetical protein